MEVQVPGKLWDTAMRMTCNNNNYHLTFFLTFPFPLSCVPLSSFSLSLLKLASFPSTCADDFGCIPGGFNWGSGCDKNFDRAVVRCRNFAAPPSSLQEFFSSPSVLWESFSPFSFSSWKLSLAGDSGRVGERSAELVVTTPGDEAVWPSAGWYICFHRSYLFILYVVTLLQVLLKELYLLFW